VACAHQLKVLISGRGGPTRRCGVGLGAARFRLGAVPRQRKRAAHLVELRARAFDRCAGCRQLGSAHTAIEERQRVADEKLAAAVVLERLRRVDTERTGVR